MSVPVIVWPCIVKCGKVFVEVEPHAIPWERPTYWIVAPVSDRLTMGFRRVRKAEMSLDPDGKWVAE